MHWCTVTFYLTAFLSRTTQGLSRVLHSRCLSRFASQLLLLLQVCVTTSVQRIFMWVYLRWVAAGLLQVGKSEKSADLALLQVSAVCGVSINGASVLWALPCSSCTGAFGCVEMAHASVCASPLWFTRREEAWWCNSFSLGPAHQILEAEEKLMDCCGNLSSTHDLNEKCTVKSLHNSCTAYGHTLSLSF